MLYLWNKKRKYSSESVKYKFKILVSIINKPAINQIKHGFVAIKSISHNKSKEYAKIDNQKQLHKNSNKLHYFNYERRY